MSRKIIVKGKVYRSVRDACIDLGIPYNTVYMTAKRHGVSVDELLNSYTIKPRSVKVAVTYDITLADGVAHQGVQMNELAEIVSAAANGCSAPSFTPSRTSSLAFCAMLCLPV